MNNHTIILRSARGQDLDDINRIVERAVMSWRLPDRVKRLVIPSYRYHTLDLQHMHFLVVEDHNHGLIGTAAWELADSTETPDAQPALLLHGIYIDPNHHREGVGSLLLQWIEKTAATSHLGGVLIKAQTDATVFFEKQDYERLPAADAARDYAHRYWKTVTQDPMIR